MKFLTLVIISRQIKVKSTDQTNIIRCECLLLTNKSFHNVLFLKKIIVRRGPYKGKTLLPNPDFKQCTCNIIMSICSIKYILNQMRNFHLWSHLSFLHDVAHDLPLVFCRAFIENLRSDQVAHGQVNPAGVVPHQSTRLCQLP